MSWREARERALAAKKKAEAEAKAKARAQVARKKKKAQARKKPSGKKTSRKRTTTAQNKKEIEKLRREITALKAQIQAQLEQLQARQAFNLTHDATTQILEHLSTFTFADAENLLIEKNDLARYNTVTVDAQNFFWAARNFKQVPEIAKDRNKLLACRLINRIRRGDAKMYELFFSELKKYFVSLVKSARPGQPLAGPETPEPPASPA